MVALGGQIYSGQVGAAGCTGCHGQTGRGDGPTARTLTGPPVGNLTDAEWKHGDRPGDVLDVILNGVRDTAMNGWGPYLPAHDARAVAAYVYHLGGRVVPPAFRE